MAKLRQLIARHRLATGVLALVSLSLCLWLANFCYLRIVLPWVYGDVTRIEIVDIGGRPNLDVTVLKIDLQKTGTTIGDQTAANAIRNAALAAFPSGAWQNVAPDASYRSIRIVCQNHEIRLDSWHPLFETNPRLVVGSRGVTSLDDQSRAEYLSSDDSRYVAARNAFDELYRRLTNRFTTPGSAPIGTGAGSKVGVVGADGNELVALNLDCHAAHGLAGVQVRNTVCGMTRSASSRRTVTLIDRIDTNSHSFESAVAKIPPWSSLTALRFCCATASGRQCATSF